MRGHKKKLIGKSQGQRQHLGTFTDERSSLLLILTNDPHNTLAATSPEQAK